MDAEITGSANLLAKTGDTWQLVLRWKQEDRTPVNLTGYTARMMVRKSWDATVVNASISTATGGGIEIVPADGKITLTLSPTQTAALIESPYVYDIELTSPTGFVTTILSGRFTVTRDVSR